MQESRYNYERPGYQNDHLGGEASSYYSSAQSVHEGNGSNQYGNENRDGENEGVGERGIMGALAGGAAGAYGGHELGGKMTGHSKTSTVIGALMGAFAGSKTENAVDDWRDDRKEKKEEEKREEEKREEERREAERREAERREEEKRENERREEEYRRRDQGYVHQNDYSSNGGSFAGNYSASSQNVRLDAYGDYNLTAECRGEDGSYRQSTISLNRIIQNENGSFRWISGGGGGQTTMAVQEGEYLREIAARFNCSFEEIAAINHLQNPDLIYPGQVLQVPGGGGCGGGNFAASAQNVRLVDGGRRLEGELRGRGGEWHTSSIILDEKIANANGSLRFR